MFSVFVRIASPESHRRGDSNKCPKHGTVNEKLHDPLIFMQIGIDVLNEFCFYITNVVIKRVYCRDYVYKESNLKPVTCTKIGAKSNLLCGLPRFTEHQPGRPVSDGATQ